MNGSGDGEGAPAERLRAWAVPRSLFGRERELALLIGGLMAAIGGRGHLFAVCGEPGMGKTRLLEAIAAIAAARGTLAVWGKCWEGNDAPPLWPWVQVLRTLGRRAGGDAAGREATEQSVRSTVVASPSVLDDIATCLRRAACAGPLLVLLDDLHAGAPATLTVLETLARDLWSIPLLIIVAYRHPDRRGRALAELFARLGADRTAVPLGGLDSASSAALIAAAARRQPAPRVVEALHTATGGNPFLLDEMVRELVADGRIDAQRLEPGWLGVPRQARSALRAQLAGLPEAARAALDAAAVAGPALDLDLLAAVLQQPADTLHAALATAAAAGVLRPEPGGPLRFANALMHETIYDDVPAPRRTDMHRRVGAVREARGAQRMTSAPGSRKI